MQGVMSKVILSFVMISVFSLVQCKINPKKINRRKQALFPFMAVVYGIATMIVVFTKYSEQSLKTILDFFDLEGNGSTNILVINIVIYFCFVVTRLVPGVIIWFLLGRYLLLKNFVEKFYVYNEENDEWLLKNQWTNVRDMFRSFVFAGGGLSGISLALTWIVGARSQMHIFIFPVVIQIVLVEIYNFLNGITETEYMHDVTGDDSLAQHISNFYKVREIYEKIFPHELLSSSTGCDYVSANAVRNVLEDLEKSESELERKVSKFFSSNNEEIYDTDGISAALKLLEGKNVVFFNPFYRDLGKYLILPFLNTLLSDKKCLVIVGRNSLKEDVGLWMSEILDEYGKIQSLWRVRELDFKDPECEVGILGFSQLYDQNILESNASFFREVGFVFILEASLIVNTGQVGLSILSQMMENSGETPVYCIADRLVDGLVDTMSHLLQTEITEVAAAPISRNIHTSMGWNADGDFLRQKLFNRQTKYLGNGIELAAVAIKNQIPKVSWFGETKIPIKDVKWIAGQYFPTLCEYMNLPIQQQSLYEKIEFISNIWSSSEEREQFIIAEDEFANMFSTMRMFLSRGKEQTFVNILSENYLLRDYMRCNTQMFMSNPNAIPSIVADYAKTERNTLFKLLLLMTFREVYESEILQELRLTGMEIDDALYALTYLLKKYTNADNTILKIRVEKKETEDKTADEENAFSILPEIFDEKFGKTLKVAYYICEDEKCEDEYLEAKLFGHITQIILPDQFVTYDGKYYIVKQISHQNGVILRRASHLYAGRKYYKQIRKYCFGPYSVDDVLAAKTIMDVEIAKISICFSVKTLGYLEMNSNNDLRSARVVDISNDPLVEMYSREYRNKSVLRIKFPDTTDRIKFSISVLLSEIFKSVFPDAWQYLAVVTMIPDDVDGMLNYLIYSVEGYVEEDYIYILEDSELDLGLLETVEKNLMSFLEIVTDFLCWHFEKMREPAMKDPEVVTPEFPAPDTKRRKKVRELFDRIWKLSGRKKEEEVKIAAIKDIEKQVVKTSDSSEVTALEDVKEEAADLEERIFKASEMKLPDAEQFESDSGESPDLVAIDGTDIFDNDGLEDDNEYFEQCFTEMGIAPLEESRYQKECFLKFGFNEIDNRLQLEEARQYLTVRGFSNNAYSKARKRDLFADTVLDLDAVNHCDFCRIPLSGVSYEKLSDGRIRCNDCSSSAINSVEEFKKIFHQCMNMMESFFAIEYKKAITVKTEDAKKIAKGFGSVYTPTTEVAERVIGYARRSRGNFSLLVENGSPRLATISVMVHELTHIWQYMNWKDKEIERLYPEKYQQDIVYEGMAVWAEVQYLYLIGEASYARKQEMISQNRTDIYGKGFNMFCEKYPLIREASLVKYTPFSQFPPM